MIYRVIQRLSVGGKTGYVEPGGTVSDEGLGHRVVAILIKKGAISPVKPPPLDILPGWKLRAKRFKEAGYNAITLLECDAALIAKKTGYKEQSIERWKKELMGFMEVKMEVKQTRTRSACCEDEESELGLAEETGEAEQIEEVTNATDE